MIVGAVISNLQGLVEIQVIHATGEAARRSFMVDTGFNGWLGLSDETLGELDVWPTSDADIMLADGTQRTVEQFMVTVVWENNLTVMTALKSGIDLIGMRMVQGNRLTMDVKQAGVVEISPI